MSLSVSSANESFQILAISGQHLNMKLIIMFASLTSLIETGLKSMNQSDFQKLAFDFLNFKGFKYIGALGAMVSANKTSPRTLDGFFEDNDGKFIFCEGTTLK